MSTTPDFCCDNKCITIKKCDGPWCLGAARQPRDCDNRDNCCPDIEDSHPHHGTKLSVGSKAACCGTLRVCDTLELLKVDGTTVTLTIREIRNGVIIAKGDDVKGYRLEGYKGHLVHVRVFAGLDEAKDGLPSTRTESYNTYSKCANKDCSQTVPSCSSTDSPCGCPCADGAAEDTGSDTESVIDDNIAQNNDGDADGDADADADAE